MIVKEAKFKVGDIVEVNFDTPVLCRVIEIDNVSATASRLDGIRDHTVHVSKLTNVHMPDDFDRLNMYDFTSPAAEVKAKQWRELRREAEAIETAGDTSLIIHEKMKELLQEIFLLEREARREKRQAKYDERSYDGSVTPQDVDAFLQTSPYEGEQVINMHFSSGNQTSVQSLTIWQAEELIKLLTEKVNEARTYNEDWFKRNLKVLKYMSNSIVKMVDDDTALGADLMRRYEKLHAVMAYAFEHLDPFVNGEEWDRVYALMEEFDKLPKFDSQLNLLKK